MARLGTDGAEHGGGYVFPADTIFNLSSATVTSSTVRTGSFAFSCVNDGDVVVGPANSAFDVSNFSRHYMRFSTVAPANPVWIVRPWDGTAFGTFGVRLETNGTLTLRDAAGAQIGSASGALTANTYYRIEHEWKVPTGGGATAGTLGLYLDGVQVARSVACNAGATGKTETDAGRVTGTATLTIIMDDIAINDSTGANQTGLPGDGKVLLLKPVSDNAIGGGWEAPQTTGSDITNIFDAVDNTPPLGVAHADTDANNLKYVFNAASSATDNYDVNCQSYTAAGVGATDTITLCRAIAFTGSNNATDTNGAVKLVSNPADSGETSLVFDNGVAGAFPTNWHITRGAIVYAPTPTFGTQPVVRIGKRTAAVRVAMCCLLGMMVEYAPGVVASGDNKERMMV